MSKNQKVYMPLMIGDWLKGTRGMRAEVRGVYLGLLLYQWDNGYIPSDMEELSLIDPELPKVWDKLRDKFQEFEPGKLKNKKNDEVKEFWQKQKKNGEKGGRPRYNNPHQSPNSNPTNNPNTNHHNEHDLDSDHDYDLKHKKESQRKFATENVTDETLALVYDDVTRETILMHFKDVDVDQEWKYFIAKVRGSPEKYAQHDVGSLRLAFNAQLRHAKKKPPEGKQKKEISLDELKARRRGNGN